jgi:L-lactate dehydrogenase complex protein LldG
MSADHIETFRASLVGSATLHETTADDATEAISAVVESPAVGTPLPFEGLSLPETVETEFSPSDLDAAQTGVTPARHAIANYGTVTLASDPEGTELASLYAPRHVAVVAASAIVPDMETAYERLNGDIAGGTESAGGLTGTGADTQVLATGPSATADMGTLVEGVHGPHEVHVVLLADR